MTLPDWLPQDLSHAKFEIIGPRFKLTGSDNNPGIAIMDFTEVLDTNDPPGYILSRARIDAEHARGSRLTWEVVWLREVVAQRRYEERQATRMSRFNKEDT